MKTEEAEKVISDIAKLRKKQRPKRSRLSKFKTDIIELRKCGASYETIALWLRQNKRVKMRWQSIRYFYINHCENKNENNE